MIRIGTAVALMVCLLGCQSVHTTRNQNQPGRRTLYENPDSPGSVQGIGVESQDIVSMADQMMRNMMANRTLAGRTDSPRIVLDSRYFRNESRSRINVNLITDLLRTELTRAANGRMLFLGREYSDMIEKERALEQAGVVSEGTQGATQQTLGWDYRLGGRIASLDSMDTRTGLTSRYHQITFEMIERGTGAIIWNGTYQFKKTAQDDILYR